MLKAVAGVVREDSALVLVLASEEYSEGLPAVAKGEMMTVRQYKVVEIRLVMLRKFPRSNCVSIGGKGGLLGLEVQGDGLPTYSVRLWVRDLAKIYPQSQFS